MKTAHLSGNDLLISSNESYVCYDDQGAGTIPVIFIHGFPFDKSTWQPQVDFLKETNRVISYDIRGFGKSPMGKGPISINQFAEDLICLMDSLIIDKAVVCGFSLGGYIFLNAISRFPERFSGVILCDTQCAADPVEVIEKRMNSISAIHSNGIADFADETISNVFCHETLEKNKKLTDRIKNVILATDSFSITETLQAITNRNETCSTLKNIRIPALILCGESDTITPPSKAEYLFNHIVPSKREIIKNAGHMSNLEQPGVFNQYLRDFIQQLPGK